MFQIHNYFPTLQALSGLLEQLAKLLKSMEVRRVGLILTLVQAHYSMKRLPLASFRGNRFNILFYDAGALYHLQSAIKEFFFASGLSTDNKLLKAVEADSKVSEFWAGCRALGLVSKFVTGPL